MLALLASVVFVGYLWHVLRDAERDTGWLAGVALSSGLLSAAIKLSSLPAALAALYRADDGISALVATALIDMNSIAFALTWATMALMLSATAGVALRTGVLPRRLGWSAIAIAVALLASLPFAASSEPPTFLLALIWIVAASVVLIRRVDTPTLAHPRETGAPPRWRRVLPERHPSTDSLTRQAGCRILPGVFEHPPPLSPGVRRFDGRVRR